MIRKKLMDLVYKKVNEQKEIFYEIELHCGHTLKSWREPEGGSVFKCPKCGERTEIIEEVLNIQQ